MNAERIYLMFNEAFNLHTNGKLAEAKMKYEEILKLDKGHQEALHLLGAIASQEGDHLKAIQMITEVIKKNPNHVHALYNLGVAQEGASAIEEAIATYGRATQVDRKFVAAYRNLAVCLQESGRPEEAIKNLETAINLQPEHLKSIYFCGTIYLSLDRIENAMEKFNKCILLNTQTHEQIRTKAAAYLQLGKWENAFNICTTVLPSVHSKNHAFLDNQENARQYIKDLPEVQFISHKSLKPQRTIAVFADESYIDSFLQKVIDSTIKTNPDLNIHLHAMLRVDTLPEKYKKLVNQNVTLSWEKYSPNNKTGYTTRRFARIYQLIQHLKQPLLCLDIDSEIVGNLDKIFNNSAKYHVGLYRVKHAPVINQMINASAFMATPTQEALRFLEFVINYICQLEEEKRLLWFADQMALIAADQWVKRNPHVGIIETLPENIVTWNRENKNALILTFKGKLKDDVKMA